jgi:hypothetical protein
VNVTTSLRPEPSRRSSRLPCVILPILLACLVLSLVLGGLVVAAPAAPRQIASIAHDQAISDIIFQITTQTLAYELAGLTGERSVVVAGSLYMIATRNSYQTEAISMATRYVFEQLADDGLDVAYHHYVWNGNHWRNVAAEKSGAIDPDEIYLITAHVDDRPEGALAPGADDNGSGSIAVLMAARLLESHHFAHTLRFVLFTGEEYGLRGSAAYAADCAARGENIEGVLNLDMIGYNTGEPVFDVYARSGTEPGASESRQLADVISDVVGVYDLDLVPSRIDYDKYPLKYGSDQWSFLKQGYPAILVIEDWDDFTPYYHQTSDKLSTLDLDYYAETTRAAIAAIAHLGWLLPEGHLSGTIHALDTGYPLADATVIASCLAYRDVFTTVTDVNGTYFSALPVGSYTITVSPLSPRYRSAIVTNVLIVTDTVVVRDIALEPWPYSFYLPLIAREW